MLELLVELVEPPQELELPLLPEPLLAQELEPGLVQVQVPERLPLLQERQRLLQEHPRSTS